MRGQVLILTGMILATAAVMIFYVHFVSSSAAVVVGDVPGYGYIARSWPDYVRSADAYTQYAASLTSFTLARGALDVGLYGRPHDGRWLHYNVTRDVGRGTLESLAMWLASFGVSASGSLQFGVAGYNGTLGPYPLAADFSNWNVTTPLIRGLCGGRYVLRPLNVRAARFVVMSYRDVGVEYVLTYVGHTSDIVTLGAGYNVILSEMLTFDNPNGRIALYAIDVSKVDCSSFEKVRDSLKYAIISLPWYAEIYQCPLCMLHFRVPAGFLQRGKVSEVLLTYSAAGIPQTDQFALEDRHTGRAEAITVQPITVSNPKAVFYSFYSGSDIVSWQRAVVRTDGQCYTSPSGGVTTSGVVISPQRPAISYVDSSARIFATYRAGTVRYGFNVFKREEWNAPVGYRVEALVMPESVQSVRPARLDIYYGGVPSTTHPICARFYGVQIVNPVLVWSEWRAGSGVWNGRTWDVGGTVYSARQWYLMSVSVDDTAVEWAVYHYDSPGRPVRLLGMTSRSPPAYPTAFWIVLGSAIVDNPGSSTSEWTEAAYYAYVRIRPWVRPEPSVALAPLGGFVFVNPLRKDVVALGRSSVHVSLFSRLNMSAALISNLNIEAYMRSSASVLSQRSRLVSPTEVEYSYLVNVSHTEPRATLGSLFFLYYVLGNTPRNISIIPVLDRYSDYWAVFNITFRVPRKSSFAVLISVPGSITARLAISSSKPRVYYVSVREGQEYAYYVANYGDGVAVLYAPWGVFTSFDDGRRSDQAFAGYFGALYNVTNGRERWHVVVIPPGGLVKFTTRSQVDIRTWAPSWVRPYIEERTTPCVPSEVRRVYFPGNVTTNYYVVHVTFSAQPRSTYVLTEGGVWQLVSFYVERSGTSMLNFMWTRLEDSPGAMSYSGRLLVLCTTGGGESGRDKVFGNGYWGSATSHVDLGTRASLGQFPDGFAVYVKPSSPSVTVGLNNATSIPGYPCQPTWNHLAIYYVGGNSPYRWQFDGFCFDQHIWEKGSGSVFIFNIALTRSTAMFRMFDSSGLETWRRSYPNAPVSLSRPFVSYRYIVVPGTSFEWYLVPFTMPEPYVR